MHKKAWLRLIRKKHWFDRDKKTLTKEFETKLWYIYVVHTKEHTNKSFHEIPANQMLIKKFMPHLNQYPVWLLGYYYVPHILVECFSQLKQTLIICSGYTEENRGWTITFYTTNTESYKVFSKLFFW
jgi:hypothetical protein